MSVLVGTLAVDVVNGQATFTLDDAKSQLDSFGKKAGETGEKVSFSMRESRESIMAVGDMFGIHLPASITRTVAGLETLGPALEAALPFAAIALGAVLLFEHIEKVHEAAEKLREDQTKFGTTIQEVYNNFDDKLLEVGKKADELRGDHFAALRKEIELIDHASLKDLVQQLEIVSKQAEATFTDLKASFADSFFQISKGSEGAASALKVFKTDYEALLAKGKDKEAGDLLAGTLDSAKKAYDLMYASQNGHGSDEKELAAQKTLIDVLEAQVQLRQKNAALVEAEKQNATTSTNKVVDDEQDKIFKRNAQEAQEAADEAERSREQQVEQDLQQTRIGEQEKIAATARGSQERIAAIDAALKQEQSMYQTYTEYYKTLVNERSQAVREAARVDNEVAAEEARHAAADSRIDLSVKLEGIRLERSMRRETSAAIIADMQQAENEEYAIQKQAMQKQIDALSTDDANYANKKKQLENKEEEMEREHQARLTKIKTDAETQRNKRILSAEDQFDSQLARSLTSALTRQKSFAAAMEEVGAKVVEGMIENTIKMALTQDTQRFNDARTAAAHTYSSVAAIPYVGPFLAPEAAAAAFAAVMAFEQGGIVPGYGGGDTVPAMLSPHEMVLPAPISQGLQNAITNNNFGGGDSHIHYHDHSSHQSLDSRGMSDVLKGHRTDIMKHIRGEQRKRPRGNK